MTNSEVSLLTGLQRSGTTLLCHLLNKLPNSVALAEPLDVGKFRGRSERAVIRAIDRFARTQRRRILREGTAVSKSDGGMVPSNLLGDAPEGGVRASFATGMALNVSNVDSPDFSLYVKHPHFFSAGLPFLSQAFECYASIRNPLSVLLSWQDCPFPVSQGRAPAAEQVSAELRKRLEAESDLLARQLIILDFCFDMYRRFLPGRVIRYEEIVNSGGRALELINPRAGLLEEHLSSRNARGIGRNRSAQVIAERLLAAESACWHFYSHADVEMLLGSCGD